MNVDFNYTSSELEKIEFSISEYVFKGKGSYELSKIIIEEQLNDIKKIILKNKITGKSIDFFWQAQLQEVNSLKTQMNIISDQHL